MRALLPSSEEMARMDRATIEGGVSGLTLMEKAGCAAADLILSTLLTTIHGPVLVLCGPGNNGGDGAVVARILRSQGVRTDCVVVGAQRRSSELTENLAKLDQFYVFGGEHPESEPSVEQEQIARLIAEAGCIVDALLGTGQKGAPRGAIAQLCEMVSTLSRGEVVSVDVPTGVDASTGEVFTPHIVAKTTIAIQHVKRGLFQYPARSIVGTLEVVDIGISVGPGSRYELFPQSGVMLKHRPADAHKGNFRRVIVVSGASELRGASILAAHAALRSGAPLVLRAVPSKEIPSSLAWPEIMHKKLGSLGRSGARKLLALCSGKEVIVMGPGLGTDADAQAFFAEAVYQSNEREIPCVIDADAITCAASLAQEARSQFAVWTPHPGEAARVLRCDSASIQRDRYGAAERLQELLGGVVVLKGASTVVSDASRGSVNSSGNPYLATGGAGDALCGVIAALIAQGYDLLEAAQWGVYLHGRAADIAHTHSGGPIIASDVIEALPFAIGEVLDGE